MSGAAVTPTGGGRGDSAGRTAAAEGGGGGSGPGPGDGGGAEGCCGPGPDPEQDPLSAAGHRGATVSDPHPRGWCKQVTVQYTKKYSSSQLSLFAPLCA